MQRANLLCAFVILAIPAAAQVANALRPFIKEDTRALVLTHVRIIDGTGAPPIEDAQIEIREGRITSVRPAGSTPASDGVKALDLTGKNAIPGWLPCTSTFFICC